MYLELVSPDKRVAALAGPELVDTGLAVRVRVSLVLATTLLLLLLLHALRLCGCVREDVSRFVSEDGVENSCCVASFRQ